MFTAPAPMTPRYCKYTPLVAPAVAPTTATGVFTLLRQLSSLRLRHRLRQCSYVGGGVVDRKRHLADKLLQQYSTWMMRGGSSE